MQYLTITDTEAVKSKRLKRFNESYILSDTEYNELKRKAKRLYNHLGFNKLDSFENQSCFISSNAVHGFFFPNLNNKLDCIAFTNEGEPVAVFNTEE